MIRDKLKLIFSDFKPVLWIIVIELVMLSGTSVYVFQKKVCLQPEDFQASNCESWVSFSEKLVHDYGSFVEGLFYFSLSILLILFIFSVVKVFLFKWIKSFKQWSIYKQLFSIQLCIIYLIFFMFAVFMMSVYNGSSCLANDCVGIPLFLFVFMWLFLFSFELVSYPLFWLAVLLSYLTVFLVVKYKQKIPVKHV